MSERMLKMRQAGVEIPRRQLNDRSSTAWVGGLEVLDTTDQGLHRLAQIARFTRVTLGHRHVETLYDQRLLWWKKGRLVLTGFERVRNEQGQFVDYAQSWLIFVDSVT
jgi:hypothetical protein